MAEIPGMSHIEQKPFQEYNALLILRQGVSADSWVPAHVLLNTPGKDSIQAVLNIAKASNCEAMLQEIQKQVWCYLSTSEAFILLHYS